MAADETTVKQRITEALNACDPGTFSTTISTNYKDRNITAIAEATREGALMIAQAVCMTPNHVHRNAYVSGTPTSLTHGGELPDMAGEGDLVEIQRVAAGSFLPGTPRTAQQIDAFRSNPASLYSSVSHTTANSPLSGYYNITNGRIRFTGAAAQMYHPIISRSTAASLVADEYEGVWFCLGMGLTIKEGDNLFPIAQYYMNIGQAGLRAISNQSAVPPVPPVERALNARSDS